MYIAIEGIDGSGKSEIANALNRILTESGRDVQRVWEPGSTPVGEALRAILKSEQGTFDEEITPTTEILLFNASRLQMLHNVVAPALKAGKIVLSDRCYLSTRAYQGYGHGLKKEVSALETLIPDDLKPDVIIYLDVGLDVAWKRRSIREETDRIEGNSEEFFRTVRDCYRTAAHMDSNLIKRVNANGPVDEVLDTVLGIISDYI
jgi:dTMP kinase